MINSMLRLRRMSPLANVCRWCSRTFLRILPCHSSNCPMSPSRGLYGNSPPESLSRIVRCSLPSPRRERARARIPAVSPVYRCDSTLATTCVSEKGRRMPVQTHVVRIVYLVLCSSMLILQNGCSNSGGGNSGTPATDSAATPHLDLTTQTSLTTTTGTPAVVADGHSTVPVRLTVVNGAGTPMAGVAVTFATTDGTLSTSPVVRVAQNLSTGDRVASGEAATGGSIAVSTDANGIAQVLLTASTTAGTAVVTADALGFRTHMDIIFVPGPAARVDLNASPNTVNASGTSTL